MITGHPSVCSWQIGASVRYGARLRRKLKGHEGTLLLSIATAARESQGMGWGLGARERLDIRDQEENAKALLDASEKKHCPEKNHNS